MIDWTSIEEFLDPLFTDKVSGRKTKRGSARYPAICLVKALLLQTWNHLSDKSIALSLSRDIVFMDFCKFSFSGSKPDGTMMLTDKEGAPVSVEVFRGNTADSATFKSQIEKLKNRFDCKKVVMVGDRGMIKSTQIC